MAYLGKPVVRNMYYGAKPELFDKAKEYRKNPTSAERVLWNILRKYRTRGYIFRQQHPVYIFIADFYCPKVKLVVEVDGEVHFNDESREHDDGRTGVMENFGIKVITFTNDQVLYKQNIVIEQINHYITEAASPALPGAGDGRG